MTNGLNVLTPLQLIEEIEKIKTEDNFYYECIEELAIRYDIEIEKLAAIIPEKIKEHLEREFVDLNMLKPTPKIDYEAV